jgi:hypothetical protein
VAAPLLLAVTLALTLPAIHLRFRDLLQALRPIACACAAMAVVVLVLREMLADVAAPVQLLALVTAGAATYGAVLWLGWPHVVRETLAMLRHRDPVASSRATLEQADAPAG